MEREIENSINIVIIYLADIGISVDISKDAKESFCDLFLYKVTIPEYDESDLILYSLLHETGHFMVDAEGLDIPENPESIDVLVNEILAWDRGAEIADTLGLKRSFFNEEEYWIFAKDNIIKYTAFFNIKI